MSPPIYTPDGSEVSEIVLPDGSTASEVIGPDGNVVFEAGPDIPDSGISHYKFEQDLSDSWSGNDLTNNSSAGYTTASKYGDYAKSYDGGDDYDYISSNIVNESGPFSISAWVKTSSSGTIFSQGNSNTVGPFLWLRSDTYAEWRIRTTSSGSGDAVTLTGSVGIQDGNWHHVVATFDSPDMKLYTDGGNKQTGSQSNIPTTNQSAFGALYRTSPIIYLAGDVDHAKFYSKVLTDTEVSNLFNTGSI